MTKFKFKFFSVTQFFPIALTLLLLSFLAGCSPHPGAGHWKAEGDNSLKISWIDVVFEGTADIYGQDKQESIRRCFWAATGKNSMQMACVHSDDTSKKETYDLVVLESGQAKLLQNEQLIGFFTEKIPELEK